MDYHIMLNVSIILEETNQEFIKNYLILKSRITFVPEGKLYRIGLLFTHKNSDFGTISVMGQSCPVLILKIRYHADSFSAIFWCSVNTYMVTDCYGSE